MCINANNTPLLLTQYEPPRFGTKTTGVHRRLRCLLAHTSDGTWQGIVCVCLLVHLFARCMMMPKSRSVTYNKLLDGPAGSMQRQHTHVRSEPHRKTTRHRIASHRTAPQHHHHHNHHRCRPCKTTGPAPSSKPPPPTPLSAIIVDSTNYG